MDFFGLRFCFFCFLSQHHLPCICNSLGLEPVILHGICYILAWSLCILHGICYIWPCSPSILHGICTYLSHFGISTFHLHGICYIWCFKRSCGSLEGSLGFHLRFHLRGGDKKPGTSWNGDRRAGEHGRDCGWGLVEASFGRLRSRHGEAWFGCARGVSLERRKECVGRRRGGKKCCNGRERVKSMFEEVEWRPLLKRLWGAKEPGRGEEVLAAREGRRSCSSWGWFESPSNRDPIALQPPQQYHSYSHSCLKLSTFSPNPLLWLHSERATSPCLACSNHSNHMHPGHAPPSSHRQASAAICNLHPAGSFASQKPPKRASPQKARHGPPQPRSFFPPTFAPHHTPRPGTPMRTIYFILPFPQFFHCFSMVLLGFSIILSSIPVSPIARRRTDQGGIEPHRHPIASWYISLKIAQNRPRRPPQLGGEVSQNCPCFQPPPPRPLFSLRSQWATSPCLTAGFRNLGFH